MLKIIRWGFVPLCLFSIVFSQSTDSVVILETETFSTWIPSGWTVLDLGGSAPVNQWFSFTYFGDSVAAITYSGTRSDDWLITPTLPGMSGVTDSIVFSFWSRFSHWPAEAGSSFVLLSHDGGTTWTETLIVHPTINSTTVEEYDTSFHLESFGPFTGNEKIAFWYHHQNGDSWYIDDVRIVKYYSEPMPPTITHEDYYHPGMPFYFAEYPETAYITDLTGVDSAWVCYDVNFSDSFSCVPMEYIGSDPNRCGLWVGNIPSQPSWSRIRYFFYARDSYAASPSVDTTDTFVFAVQDNYYQFDDVDSDPERPETTWFDIISRGAYKIDDSWTALTDYSAIGLPFTFRYYGVDYDTVYVHMCGAIRFSDTLPYFDISANQNYPDTTYPNGFAGLWAKLVANASYGGDVWVYDSDDDTFAVLFDSMGWVAPGGATIDNALTMEILLISPAICDEPGGNGEIIVRFRGVNDSLLTYCTLGLENERGLLGTVYLHNGSYDEYAEGITSTRAIKFTTTPPAYWGNAGVVRGYADLRGTPSPGDSGIVLELVDRDMITHTLNNGFYEFLAVPPGRYFARATYTGYNFDISPSFTISERETVFLDTLFITPILPSNRYVEDFEDNPQPGVFSGEWEWGSVNADSFRYSTVPPQTAPPPGAHSGTKMWGTLLNGEYKNASCDTLIFPAGPEIITFWHYYDTEPTRDGGLVLYSEDFCQSWQVAHPLGGYDDSVYALGDSGFTGFSGAWVKDSVDLRGTAATNIAFVFASDSIGTAAGWYLDDIFIIRPARKTGTITGYVYDNVDYTPVVSALVFGGGDSTYTDGIGHFVLDSADAGIYNITVQCPGYITNSANILLGKGDTISLNIALYKIEITPEDTSDYEFEFSYGQHDTQTVQICNPAPDTVQVGIVVLADDSTPGEIGICDSIVIDDVPSMSIPVAVGCRGRGHLTDYWITSYDPAVGNRYNFKFDDAKNYAGVRYSSIPYTGLTEIAGDMTYDGRYFWQTVPGRNTIYAWNPNDGNLVDSIVAPAWAGWHSADTLVCGIGYDVVNDVFYLSDTLGKIRKVAGKTWTHPGEELAVWQVYRQNSGENFHIYALAYDFGRRTLWAFGSDDDENILAELSVDGDTFAVLYQTQLAGKVFALDIGADRKLWAVYQTEGGERKIYAIAQLAPASLPLGFAISADTLTIPPGECETLTILSSPGAYCQNFDLTLGFSAGVGRNFSPPREYSMHIVVSPELNAGWNLISVPVAPSLNDVVIQLEDDISPFFNEPSNSNIFGWDPERGMYVVPDSFTRGEGYFVKAWSNQTHFDIAGTPYYSDFTKTLPYYETSLYPGWFLVGNPVNYAVDWDAIVANPVFRGIAPTYYVLTPFGWASYTPGFPAGAGRYIAPYQGFFVSVLPGATGTLPFWYNAFIPARKREIASSPDFPDFVLRISASTPEETDRWNFLGTRPDALDTKDIYDAEIPPALPHTDFVSFVSDEGEPLSADIRSSFGEGVSRKQWRLRVDGLDPGEVVEIFWDRDHLPDEKDCSYGTNQIPEIYEIIFTNPATGENIDMRETNSYRFTYSGPTEFIITVSTASLGIKKSKLPSTITVLSNTPNPFNSATEIKFGLPEDSRITIDIVDINGKIVRKLVSNSEFSAGWHSVIWNGCDNNGQPAPSGVYFCRIITEDAEISQKMLLVK